MSGAISRSIASDYDPSAAAATDPNAAYADPMTRAYNQQLAARGQGALNQPMPDNPYADSQQGFAQSLRGDSDPNQQLGALQQSRDAAAQQKIAAINQARLILQATRGDQSTNLPLLAAAGAMLKPTRTGGFAESLGNAFEAASPVIAAQRQRDLALAGTTGQLGTEAAGVPLDVSQADVNDFWHRMQLAEQAGSSAAITGTRMATQAMRSDTSAANNANTNATHSDIAAGNQATRLTVAEQNNAARLDRETIRANSGKLTPLGLATDGSGDMLYAAPNQQIVRGPAVDKVQAQGATAAQVEHMVQAEKNRLSGTNPKFNALSQEDQENMARGNVMRGLGQGGYSPGRPTSQPASPALRGPPAGAAQQPQARLAAPAASQAQPAGTPSGAPPQGAIDMLKADPSKRRFFDRKYGAGAAAQVLGQ